VGADFKDATERVASSLGPKVKRTRGTSLQQENVVFDTGAQRVRVVKLAPDRVAVVRADNVLTKAVLDGRAQHAPAPEVGLDRRHARSPALERGRRRAEPAGGAWLSPAGPAQLHPHAAGEAAQLAARTHDRCEASGPPCALGEQPSSWGATAVRLGRAASRSAGLRWARSGPM
jgi:hypothetical protein